VLKLKLLIRKSICILKKRVAGRNTSKYVDKYNDYLYVFLLKQTKEMKLIKKEVRRIRCVPVAIGGSSYISPISIKNIVKEKIDEIIICNQYMLLLNYVYIV